MFVQGRRKIRVFFIFLSLGIPPPMEPHLEKFVLSALTLSISPFSHQIYLSPDIEIMKVQPGLAQSPHLK